MKIIDRLINYIMKKNSSNACSPSDIYNTQIFKSGLNNLLNEYKQLVKDDSNNNYNDKKIKEIDFHINILERASSVNLK